MTAVSMGVVDTASVQNRLTTTSEKETLEIIGLTMERPFNTTQEKETLDAVGSILASPFF